MFAFALILAQESRWINMPLLFRGCVHPPPTEPLVDPTDLTAGEIATANISVPLLYEHNAAEKCGRVLCSWQGPNGDLRVCGIVTDREKAMQIQSGELLGLSLGTQCIKSDTGKILHREQKEVSLCTQGRRSGTWIYHTTRGGVLGGREHNVSFDRASKGYDASA